MITATLKSDWGLKDEILELKKELQNTKEELEEFKCPYCNAKILQKVDIPLDSSQDHWDLMEVFNCGYQTLGSHIEKLCPKGPKFPKFEDYELKYTKHSNRPEKKWCCLASPKTDIGRHLPPLIGIADTKKEAESIVKHQYIANEMKYTKE